MYKYNITEAGQNRYEQECWANKELDLNLENYDCIPDNLSVKNRVYQELPVSVWMFLVYSESSMMTNTLSMVTGEKKITS